MPISFFIFFCSATSWPVNCGVMQLLMDSTVTEMLHSSTSSVPGGTSPSRSSLRAPKLVGMPRDAAAFGGNLGAAAVAPARLGALPLRLRRWAAWYSATDCVIPRAPTQNCGSAWFVSPWVASSRLLAVALPPCTEAPAEADCPRALSLPNRSCCSPHCSR